MRDRLLQVVRSTPARLLLGPAFLLVAVIVRDVCLGVVRSITGPETPPPLWMGPRRAFVPGLASNLYAVVGAALTIALGILAYRLFVAWLEARDPTELGRPRSSELASGTLIGAAMILFIVAVLTLRGEFRIDAVNAISVAVVPLAGAATAAVMEELLFRGMLLRIAKEWLGSWLALGATALLFGTLHSGNENATLWSSLAVGFAGGGVLGAGYLLTQRLWFPIGMHFAANATQGALLGMAVSGADRAGWLQSSTDGDPLWTGGAFGLEASILVLPLAALIAGVLMARARTKGRLRPGSVEPFLTSPRGSAARPTAAVL